MLGRAPLVALTVLSLAFAGCLKPDGEKPVEQTNVTDVGLTPEQTVAPDGRGEISAFNETNATETTGIGSMVHEHDYWNGKERLEVGWIDAGLIPFPLFPCKRSDGACSLGATSPSTSPDSGDTYPAGTAIADFDLAPPPEMGMVYEGTNEVELKLVRLEGPEAGTPPNPAGKVFFDYLTASDEAGKFRKGGELKLNEPFKIPIQPTEADMPHQTKSLWIFRIYSNSEMVWFTFNITVTAVRGYDVVNWPPHPDLYAERAERVVFDGPVKLSSKGTLDSNVFGSDAGWIRPERVISWGTERLEIEITDVATASQLPPAGYAFEYHNASKPPLLGNGAQYGGRLTDPGSDGKTFRFSIDLTQDRGDAYDTPYAQYSRWAFRLIPQFDQGAGACVDNRFAQQFLVGCQVVPYETTYKMKITAYGRSTAQGVPASAT